MEYGEKTENNFSSGNVKRCDKKEKKDLASFPNRKENPRRFALGEAGFKRPGGQIVSEMGAK